jgi:hypothetical protein
MMYVLGCLAESQAMSFREQQMQEPCGKGASDSIVTLSLAGGIAR